MSRGKKIKTAEEVSRELRDRQEEVDPNVDQKEAPEKLSLGQLLEKLKDESLDAEIMKKLEKLDKLFRETVQNWDGFNESYKAGFISGIRHFVTVAELNMAKEMGFSSREGLVSSGKLPAWWIISLVGCFVEDSARFEAPYQVLVLPHMTPSAILEARKVLEKLQSGKVAEAVEEVKPIEQM